MVWSSPARFPLASLFDFYLKTNENWSGGIMANIGKYCFSKEKQQFFKGKHRFIDQKMFKKIQKLKDSREKLYFLCTPTAVLGTLGRVFQFRKTWKILENCNQRCAFFLKFFNLKKENSSFAPQGRRPQGPSAPLGLRPSAFDLRPSASFLFPFLLR